LYGQAIIYQELSYMVRMVVMSCEIIDRRRGERKSNYGQRETRVSGVLIEEGLSK
jgi:hypothetical protein